MGTSETNKAAKEPKTPTVQEQSSSTPTSTTNPDWSSFQAYSPVHPHGFMASSPQGHPYMWGVQGSYPFSPFPMPSPNGVAEASGNTLSSTETDGKLSEGKEKLPIKRSKRSLSSSNMVTGKNNGPSKTSGASANGVCLRSVESASERSSEGSDADSQNDSQMKSGSEEDSLEAEAPSTMVNMPPCVPGPTTNLNIGMDCWGAAVNGPLHSLNGNAPHSPVAGAIVPAGSRENIQSQPWLQDERELKRQRRKQSNRESARRSRLRKQAECDELAQRAEVLNEENATLRVELSHIRSEYEQLLSENASLKERLGEFPGQEDPRGGGN